MLQRALFRFSCIAADKLEAPQIVSSPAGGVTSIHFSSSSKSVKASSVGADVMPSSSLVYDSPLLSRRKKKNNNNNGGVNKKEPKKKIRKDPSIGITKVGMMAFVVSMCLALPIALLPFIVQARWRLLMKFKRNIPFYSVRAWKSLVGSWRI
eukprot:scaffold8983_cov52-Cylindrotheca_fusiformis.AAC.1